MEKTKIFDKNYAEQKRIANVTNLEPERSGRYVTMELFNKLLHDFRERLYGVKESHSEKYVYPIIESYKIAADKEAAEIEVVTTDIPEEKPLSICPWCGTEMHVMIDEQNEYNARRSTGYSPLFSKTMPINVIYECHGCGARSPWIALSSKLISHENLEKDIGNVIDDVKRMLEEEDEE